MARKAFGYDTLVSVLDQNLPSRMTGVTPRDSDREMVIQILQFSGCNLTAEQMTCMRQFNLESLTRARRKLQEAGNYLPSPEVAKKRRLKSYEIQQTSPEETAQGLHARIVANA